MLAPACLILATVAAAAPDAESNRVREVASRLWYHGITEELAKREVGTAGVPTLLALLDDPGFPRPDNAVAFLGWLAGGEATPALAALAESRGDAGPELDRARLLAPEALGRIASRGDAAALERLLAWTAQGSAILPDPARVERAIRGLALAKSPREEEGRSSTASSSAVAREFDASGAAAAIPDPSGHAHETPLTWANHRGYGVPMTEAQLAVALAYGNQLVGAADRDTDVACCATFRPEGPPGTFGSSGDGLDAIDNEAELIAVIDNAAGRVKVVRVINWCGEPATNVIGCSYLGGWGMVLVRFGNTYDEGAVWLHEYGHNAGLPHAADPNDLMYPFYTGGNRVVSGAACAAFHAPPPAARSTPFDLGVCADGDLDGTPDGGDNCPAASNPGQYDADRDLIGDACDTCPWDDENDRDQDGFCGDIDNCEEVFNLDQADTDHDFRGDACDACPFDASNDGDGDGRCADADNCPLVSNAGQQDRDADGVGDLCDHCPDVPDPRQEDSDWDGAGDACDPCPYDASDDLDEDGRCSNGDNCADVPNADQANADGDPRGDACDVCPLDPVDDIDGDGRCGNDDFCPGFRDPVPSERLTSGVAADFGRALAAAGDVNGDGFADLVVGAPGAGGGAGAAHLYLGTAGGIAAAPSWSIAGAIAGERLGSSVAGGDLDGDGRAELAVAAYDPTTGGDRVVLYRGTVAGPSSTPWRTYEFPFRAFKYYPLRPSFPGDLNGDGKRDFVIGRADLDARSFPGEVLVYLTLASGPPTSPSAVIAGPAREDGFGARVVGGDFDGDGRADLAVAGPRSNAPPAHVFVFRGTAAGPSATPTWTFAAPELSWKFGWGLAAGDFNGDGFDDLAVGDPEAARSYEGQGVARVFLGGSAGLPAEPAWQRSGGGRDFRLGESLAVADFDADGRDDLVVGAPGYLEYPFGRGRAVVYAGSASGPGTAPSWFRDGEADGDAFGFVVAAAGDVNGDGFADAAVAADRPDDVRVFTGSPTGLGRPASDRDGDGLGDGCDTCPDLAGAPQDDADADGVGDACDACPVDPLNDADADAVCDGGDNCPGTPNADQTDFDGDGYGDACEAGVFLSDADRSGRVDGLDLVRLGRAFGTTAGDARYDTAVDLDRDGDVDGDDLARLAATFGRRAA